jgi:hypothetical protein
MVFRAEVKVVALPFGINIDDMVQVCIFLLWGNVRRFEYRVDKNFRLFFQG